MKLQELFGIGKKKVTYPNRYSGPPSFTSKGKTVDSHEMYSQWGDRTSPVSVKEKGLWHIDVNTTSMHPEKIRSKLSDALDKMIKKNPEAKLFILRNMGAMPKIPYMPKDIFSFGS